MFQKFRGTFCLNIGYIFECRPIQKLPHSCPKWVDTKSYLTDVQNEGGRSRLLLDNVQMKDAYFVKVSAYKL